jgi:hypothetical protein
MPVDEPTAGPDRAIDEADFTSIADATRELIRGYTRWADRYPDADAAERRRIAAHVFSLWAVRGQLAVHADEIADPPAELAARLDDIANGELTLLYRGSPPFPLVAVVTPNGMAYSFGLM